MLVVADTSPLKYLILIRQDTLGPLFYERVVIPPTVHGELQCPHTPTVVRQSVAQPPGLGRGSHPVGLLWPLRGKDILPPVFHV
jgi:hypothetical protein